MADEPSNEKKDEAAVITNDNGSLILEDAPEAQQLAPRPLSRPDLGDYDPRPHHDKARRRIAYWLLVLLSGLLVCAFMGFGALFFVDPPPTFDELKTLVELILTPLLTLVSAATGFYFGSQDNR